MGRQNRKQASTTGKVVVYLRVSGDEQAKVGHGLDSQRNACLAFASQHSLEVLEVCADEGISGTLGLDRRPGLARAVSLCELRQADSILTYSQDRIARSQVVFEIVRDRATRAPFRIITARDGLDLTTQENEIPGDVMALVASIERKMIARRLLAGRRERSKRDGLGSGFCPFGYTKTAGGVAIVPNQAAIIRRLFALRGDGATYATTAQALNDDGVTTPTGRPWTTATVQGIERNRTLYATGKRSWHDVTAAHEWPAIL